jgi:Tfp pilus assembly protein PilF
MAHQMPELRVHSERFLPRTAFPGWAKLLPPVVILLGVTVQILAQTNAAPARLQSRRGQVDYAKAASSNWLNAPAGQALAYYDRLRTHPFSEAAVQLADFSIVRLGELSQLELVPPRDAAAKARFHFESGRMYFIDRLKPREMEIQTRGAVAAILGTEFALTVDATGHTELTLVDGRVELSNAFGTVSLEGGDRGIVVPGQAPLKQTAVLKGTNLVQWYLYYPAVLDPDELRLTDQETADLAASLTAYRAGDLLAALASYPGGRPNRSASERAYAAGLSLAGGRATNHTALLQDLDFAHPATPALHSLLAAVAPTAVPAQTSPATNASQLLARSYYLQSVHDLEGALTVARAAVERSPQFGFAWIRVAELEFSFGRNERVQAALRRALELSPRHGQAHSLRGFILLSAGQTREARQAFETALSIDSRLANAWLGRGLAQFQDGKVEDGRRDLQTATVMEPNRWLLRSYLAKAYGAAAERAPRGAAYRDLIARALRELALGQEHDPRDPTPWLYGALLKDTQHRTGEAVRDLERSVALNDQRRVYRSRFLLDQDLAVRSAGLASIYQRAGLDDVSLREAARAVTLDYANYSAHLFLANSFAAFRDPTRFNLRYETVWFNELLLANLLAPVRAGALSQNISQQEYFRLFERDQLGLLTDSQYRSDDQFRQTASQFGTIGQASYALDLEYQHHAGRRPNNELDRLEWYTTFKQQVTSQDTLLLLTKYQEFHSGDHFRYYEPTNARPDFHFDEEQSPIIVAGYHREWTPGIHTLLLGGRVENAQRFSDRNAPQALLLRDTQIDPAGPLILADTVGLDVAYRSRLEAFTAESQQVWDNSIQTCIVGARWQWGEFTTAARLANPSAFVPDFPVPAFNAHVAEDFERGTAYLYETLKLPGVRLAGGLTYEHLSFPRNFRAPPISAGQDSRQRWNPKASLVWDVSTHAAFRAAYARTLGGVSLDETFRLEPTQLAGFSQDFRTLIPESLVGSVTAPDHQVLGAAWDFKPAARFYLGLDTAWLQSDVQRSIGVFDYFFAEPPPNIVPASTRQTLAYDEVSAAITASQLLTDEWTVNTQYRFVRAELDQNHPALGAVAPTAHTTRRADLHRVHLGLLYQHPSGFFARTEGQWYLQENLGSAPVERSAVRERDLPDDAFFQWNLAAGLRFPRQRGDLTLGVLNLADADYRLNPISPHDELPRERVFYAQLRLRF